MAHDEDITDEKPIAPVDGYTRWIVGVVGSAILAALGFLAISDRNSVEERLELQRQFAITTSSAIAVHQYRLDEQRDRLQRIETKLDAILERLPARAR